ncbi:MAG: energy-coupling factor ABC transporter ATP-binding protein [Candidatus Paralactobacillus gallistercoris]|uniref:Energy-coupling factor ABC transporter ATP-binding protein n=1 Tax=Candidatus Paralactobacillus gallistercoris TaxID=2838724 RepID=A0A948TKN4_9LACO|nr:energy-coupling factor ABC transporter ATP-binding protein [Candidatus Paralactobacillus gallistercoris]
MEFEVKNLSFGYGKKDVLRDVNFNIDDNEYLCLMGPNGSGKSTLMQIMSGFLKAKHGEVLFQGKPLNTWLADDLTKKTYHQKVGILFQNVDIQLFNSSVYEEVAFGPKQMELPAEVIAQRVNDCLALLGITSLKDRVPYHLSGGEKRKVALASVLALNPEVILLDEPLVGLTEASRLEFLQLFAKLHQSGKTLIMITHYYNQIKNYASDFLIFDENYQVIKRSAEEIRKNEHLLEQVQKF